MAVLSKLSLLVGIVLAPALASADVPPCIVGAVQAATNPWDVGTACGHVKSVSSQLEVICGSQIDLAMSVFSVICRHKGTPISGGNGQDSSSSLSAMITVITPVSTVTMKLAPAAVTTLVVPIMTRTISVFHNSSVNTNTVAAATTAFPTASIVGGSGFNASVVTSVTSDRAGNDFVSGLVVSAETRTLISSSVAEPIASWSSSALAALATGNMGPIALAFGAGLLDIW